MNKVIFCCKVIFLVYFCFTLLSLKLCVSVVNLFRLRPLPPPSVCLWCIYIGVKAKATSLGMHCNDTVWVNYIGVISEQK